MSRRSGECHQIRKSCIWLSLLIGLLTHQPLFAQNEFHIPRDLHQYSIAKWGADDGLPQLTVRQLLRSSDGYLWLGTQKGLSRFDGVHFENFTAENVPALGDGFICDIFEDSNQQLWIATRAGGLLRYRNGQFEAITSDQGLADNFVTAIAEDSQGRLWLGTTSGVSLWWRNTASNYGPKDGLPGKGVTDIAIDHRDRVWVGTREGLFQFVEGSFVRAQDFPAKHQLAHINQLYLDNRQRLWVLMDDGLIRLQQDTWHTFENPDDKTPWEFSAIAIDHRLQIWLGTVVNSLARIKDGEIQTLPYAEDLIGRRIHALTTDEEHNLWLGTSYGLVQIRDPKTYALNENQGLSYNMVTPLLVDRERGGIWIGTNGGGLNFYQKGKNQHFGPYQGLQTQSVFSLALDPEDNKLWIGTRQGLTSYDNEEFRDYGAAEGLNGDYVRALNFDSEGQIWVGTREGLYLHQDQRFVKEPQLETQLIRAIYRDRTNAMWVASNEGIYKREPDQTTFTHYTEKDGLASLFVRSMYQDLKGNLWVGTYGGGLHLFKNGRFHALQEQDGLASNIVFDIREDTNENLWFSALKGIQKIPIQHLLEFTRDERETLEPQLVRLRTTDGNYAEINGGFYPAGASLPDGSLLYPSTNGVQIIHPSMAAQSDFHPKVVLTEIAVDGQDLPISSSFDVDSQAEKVEFHFTSLSLTRSSDIRFKVKLEGFDRDWEHIDHRRYHYYTSLPPGQYTFRVMATNADGIWSDQSAVVSFNWKPRLYQTTWFWLGCVALLLLLVVLAFQWRMLHLRKRERQLQELVENRTQALTEANRELTQAHERLVRSAHFAGMAEIATNVLHTVGNELNSVYVSISLLEQKTKKLRIQFPKVVAGLLQEHRDDFPKFLDQDPKGQKLIPTLESMTDLLRGHQQTVYKELDALQKKITNIHNVVRTLPEHAEVGSFNEKLNLVDLIEEALSMQRLTMQEHGVTLKQDFEYQPLIKVQKSKFLQVLVNLIKNAWEAALETQEPNAIVEITTHRGEEGRVILEISDNGSGIEASEQKRIFNQGYTTKEKGNGFGLHFCGNVVAEMKGHIDVHSDGKHKGATFRLDLPTKSV